MRASCALCRSIARRATSNASGPAAGSFSSWAALRIGASGLRSSCASTAMKSCTWRAATSTACECCRWVRSWVTLAKPRSRPSASRSAVTTTLAQKRVPSLRTRQPSSSARPCSRAIASSAHGLAGGDVVGAVEAREVLADDLGGLVALDAARAGVPAGVTPSGSSMKMA